MKKLFILSVVILVSATGITNSQEGDIPDLENPMSLKYLEKNLRKSQPRLVYTPKLVNNVRKKISTDPVSKNLYEAIRINAGTIYEKPLLQRVLTGKRLLGVSREFLYRMNMLGFVYLMEEDEQ